MDVVAEKLERIGIEKGIEQVRAEERANMERLREYTEKEKHRAEKEKSRAEKEKRRADIAEARVIELERELERLKNSRS